MKNLLVLSTLFIILFCPCFSNAQPVEVKGAFNDSISIYLSFPLVASFPDTTPWIGIGSKKFFSLFSRISTDSTYYLDALGGDSLDFDVYYELDIADQRQETSGIGGYWRYGETEAMKIMDFTTADTANGGRWYQSFHAPVDSSGSISSSTALKMRISPAKWIRFILKSGSKHKTNNVSLKFDLILWRQS